MLQIEEIKQLLEMAKLDAGRREAILGQQYYEAHHEILQLRMFYFDEDGVLQEDTIRNNARICHPFFTELVDQQVQYMLSGADEGFIKAKKSVPELQNELDIYFNDDFNSELSDVLLDVCTKGYGYMHAYKGSDDRLHFQYADSLGVVEVRAKDSDDHCEYIIYWYVERIDKGNKVVKKIQVSDSEKTWFYVQVGSGEIEIDTEQPINPRPLYMFTKDGGEEKYWSPLGFVPFFRLDNNKKRKSNLAPIKSLIDDYDIMACGLSNNLQDFDHPLYVVKGFDGDSLDELTFNLKTKKTIGVEEEGGVEVKTIDIPVEARKTKLELDEKNIYRFGMGFNSAQMGDGNITNIVIRSRYALLDLKCDKLEKRLKQFLKRIIRVVIAEINAKHGTMYTENDVFIRFKREIMTNAQDNAQIELTNAQRRQVEVNTILSLSNIFDNETVAKHLCDALDIDFEDVKGKLLTQDEDELEKVMQTLNEVESDEQKAEGNTTESA